MSGLGTGVQDLGFGGRSLGFRALSLGVQFVLNVSHVTLLFCNIGFYRIKVNCSLNSLKEGYNYIGDYTKE